MDFLFLPDEMIASVLKYTNYTTIIQLRKTSDQINKVAKHYDVGTRFPVTSITLSSYPWFNNTSTLPWRYTLDFDTEYLKCHSNVVQNDTTSFTQRFNRSDGSHLDIIHNLLKKVTLKQSLNIFALCLPVDDQLLQVFANNSSTLRMSILDISVTKVACSETSVKTFLKHARQLRVCRIGYYTSGTDVFSRTEVLQDRRWDCINLQYINNGLNDQFLLKVVKNCQKCVLNSGKCVLLTLSGVLKFIETLVKEEITPEYIDLGAVKNDRSSVQEAEDMIRLIDSIFICTSSMVCQDQQINEGPEGLWRNIQISFLSSPENVFLKFTLK